MQKKEFYSQLGRLLFAVANADDRIPPEERETLHKLVREQLVSREKATDVFGSNLAYYTEIEFDYLDSEEADAESSLLAFIDFIKDHRTAFDDSLQALSLYVVEQLAASFHGINKKEKKLIAELKDLLQTLR